MLTETNSATPRTDAVEFYAGDLDGGQEAVPADFARQLESELQRANAAVLVALQRALQDEKIAKLEEQLNAAMICAGVASKERGEWAVERERLLEEAAFLCDREADRQSAYEGSVRDRGLKATHAAAAMILIAVAQRIRELKPGGQ